MYGISSSVARGSMVQETRRKVAKLATLTGVVLVAATIWGTCAYGLSPSARDPYGAADRACMDVRGSANQTCIEEKLQELEPIVPLRAIPVLLGVGFVLALARPINALLERHRTQPRPSLS